MSPLARARPVTRAKKTVNTVLRRCGYEIRRFAPDRPDRRDAGFRDQAIAIVERHDRQTREHVDGLRDRYEAPVFGRVRVWGLVELLAQCVDPSDRVLYCASQQIHVLQVIDGMQRDGVADPDLLLAALIHDLGKVLLLTDADPADVVCMNSPIGSYEPGVGLDNCTLQWNHDEFAYTRFKDYVPDHIAWLVRYHSIELTRCEHLMDDRDRDYADRYLSRFYAYDQGTKSPFRLPGHRIDEYRDIVEEAFPDPIPF